MWHLSVYSPEADFAVLELTRHHSTFLCFCAGNHWTLLGSASLVELFNSEMHTWYFHVFKRLHWLSESRAQFESRACAILQVWKSSLWVACCKTKSHGQKDKTRHIQRETMPYYSRPHACHSVWVETERQIAHMTHARDTATWSWHCDTVCGSKINIPWPWPWPREEDRS
jgi:hypothetical protein